MFWGSFVRKYSKLPKFIQKIDPNLRMSKIFMDSLDKSAFYIPYRTKCLCFIRMYRVETRDLYKIDGTIFRYHLPVNSRVEFAQNVINYIVKPPILDRVKIGVFRKNNYLD